MRNCGFFLGYGLKRLPVQLSVYLKRRARRCGDPATGRVRGGCCPLRTRETPVRFGQGVRPQQVHPFLVHTCTTPPDAAQCSCLLPRCASSHATTANRLLRPVRDLPRWMHCRRVENRHDVSVVEHDDHPQVRVLRLDARCCPHFTVRPMHPYAAGSCSSTASPTRSINPEQLGTEKSSVAAQRAAALDPVNTAARAPVSSACRRSSWARKADSHLAHRCLPVLPDRECTSLGCGTLVSSGPGSLRSRLSWSYGV